MQTKEEKCMIHTDMMLKFLMFDSSKTVKDRLLCDTCLKEQEKKEPKNSLTTLKTVQQCINNNQSEINNEIENEKQSIINKILDFCQILSELKNKFDNMFQAIDQITQNWINAIKKYKVFVEDEDLVNNIQQFYFNDDVKKIKIQQIKTDFICQNEKINIEYSDKIYQLLQEINMHQCFTQLEEKINPNNFAIKQTFHLVDKKDNLAQNQKYLNFAFNSTNDIIATGKGCDLLRYNLNNYKLNQEKKFQNHSDPSICIIFSKQNNWLATGTRDSKIVCYKESQDKNDDWQRSQDYFHNERNENNHRSGSVRQLILNKEEDRLISSDNQGQILIWKVNQQKNELTFLFRLEDGHSRCHIFGLCLNEKEDSLITCGEDNKIILWEKTNQDQWINKFEYIKEQVMGVCFVDNYELIIKSKNNTILNILKVKESKIEEQEQQSIQLNDQEIEDYRFIQPLYLPKKHLLFVRHNQYCYFLKKNINGQFKLINIRQSHDNDNQGHISQDGTLFVDWDIVSQQMNLYEINYK